MHYKFEANNKIYITNGNPGSDSALCISRDAGAGRGHPAYSRVTRSVPASAEKVAAPKTVVKLLRQFSKEA